MNNSFLNQFSENIKFKYFCFDRVIIRGYILSLFFPAGIVRFLRAIGFKGLSNGVMRILTDQLNGHIQKVAKNGDIPIHWWPSEGAALMAQNQSSWNGNTPRPLQEKRTMSFVSSQTKNQSGPLPAGNSFQKRGNPMNASMTVESRSNSTTSTFTMPSSAAHAI